MDEADHYSIYYRKPQQIIILIRREVFDTLYHENNENLLAKHVHLTKLEKLIENFRIFLCGNFYLEPFKENVDDFRLEREFIGQNMFGYFIFNMDKFNNKICQNYVKIFMHIVTKYAYGTRRPFVERLENKGRILFERLFHFLATDPNISFFAAKMLCCCCQQKCLALKLIDFHGTESDSSVPIYITLFQLLITKKDYNHLVQIFKVLKELLLVNVEVANYAFHRDLHLLIDVFNRIFCHADNYYVRLSSINLFGQLIQNRHLQKLITPYTTNLDNFKLLYSLMNNADQENRKLEFTKLFEIVRLFILNPFNDSNDQMRQMFIDEYVSLYKLIEKAQRIRSYSDIALFTPEYADVIIRLNQITNKINKNDSNLNLGSFHSEDSI